MRLAPWRGCAIDFEQGHQQWLDIVISPYSIHIEWMDKPLWFAIGNKLRNALDNVQWRHKESPLKSHDHDYGTRFARTLSVGLARMTVGIRQRPLLSEAFVSRQNGTAQGSAYHTPP